MTWIEKAGAEWGWDSDEAQDLWMWFTQGKLFWPRTWMLILEWEGDLEFCWQSHYGTQRRTI